MYLSSVPSWRKTMSPSSPCQCRRSPIVPSGPDRLGQARESHDVGEEHGRVPAPRRAQVVIVACKLGRNSGGEVAHQIVPRALGAHALDDQPARVCDRKRRDDRHQHRDEHLLHAVRHLDEVRLLGAHDGAKARHPIKSRQAELGHDAGRLNRERKRSRPAQRDRETRPEHEPWRVAVQHAGEEQEEEHEAVEPIVKRGRQRLLRKRILRQERKGQEHHVDEREEVDEPVPGAEVPADEVGEPAERDEYREQGFGIIEPRRRQAPREPESDKDHGDAASVGSVTGGGDGHGLEALGDAAVQALRFDARVGIGRFAGSFPGGRCSHRLLLTSTTLGVGTCDGLRSAILRSSTGCRSRPHRRPCSSSAAIPAGSAASSVSPWCFMTWGQSLGQHIHVHCIVRVTAPVFVTGTLQ